MINIYAIRYMNDDPVNFMASIHFRYIEKFHWYRVSKPAE